jgi:hypothetical protein
MATPIRLKRSAVAGRIPAVEDLQLGELALNFYDGKLYVKQKRGLEEKIVEIGANINELVVTSGISTINGTKLDINTNTTEINGIKITAAKPNTINTISSGELRLTSIGSIVSVDGRLNVSGIASVFSDLTVGGSADIGDNLSVENTISATDLELGGNIIVGDLRIGVDGPTIINSSAGNLTLDSATGTTIIGSSAEFQQNVFVNGLVDVTGNFLASGYADIKDVRIGYTSNNEIDTAAGILVLDSASGLVYIDDRLQVVGVTTFSSPVNVNSGLRVTGVTTFTNYVDFDLGLSAKNVNIAGIDDPNLIYGETGELKLSSTSRIVRVLQDSIVGRNFEVVGLSTFNNNVDINAPTYIQEVQVGVTDVRTIDTVSGDLILKAGDLVRVDNDLIVTGISTIQGTLDVGSNLTAPVISTGSDVSQAITITDGLIRGPSEILIDPHPHDDIAGTVRIRGDLYVEGRELIVDSARIELADFNVGIASTVSSNILLDGAGIGIGSTGIRKTLTYDYATDSLESSENFNLPVGKSYKIGGVDVIGSQELVVDHIVASGLSTVGVITATGSIFGQFDGNLNSLGKTYYVSLNGSDTESGNNINQPFRTVKHALSVATDGDVVNISPGTYVETCPLIVPAGVTVKGSGLRATAIKPSVATITKDIFKLNNISTVEDLTIKDSYYDSVADTGYAFSYAPGAAILTRSPYVQRVTVLNRGTSASPTDPYGYTSADAGRGAKVDGSVIDSNSLEAGFLFNEVTFFTPNQRGVILTNGARTEYLNCFHYFANQAVTGIAGTTGIGGNANARFRVVGLTTTPVASDIVRLYSGGVGIATGTVVSYNSGVVRISGKGTGIFNKADVGTTQDIRIFQSDGVTQVGTASTITFVDYTMFGAELRSIGCAFEYGSIGVVADGYGVEFRLFAANFNHVGSGKDFSNDDTLTIQSNEVIELNGGQVSYVSIDEGGDFRVGDAFIVDQENGNVSFAATSSLNITGDLQISDAGAVGVATITSTSIRIADLQLDTNKIQSVDGFLVLDSQGGKVHITDSVEVDGSLTVDGNITLGTGASDNLIVNAESTFGSDVTFNAGIAATDITARNIRIGVSSTNEIDTSAGKLTLDSAEGTVEITDQLEVTGVSTFYGRVGFNTTDSLKVPVGTLAERVTNQTGSIRFNTTSGQFEGYGASAWGSLGGVKDVNQDTYIVPEISPGSNEDVFYFYNNGTNTLTIGETGANLNVDLNSAGIVTATSFHGKGGDLTLGGNTADQPTDGDYKAGGALNTFNSSTKIVDSVDELNELAFNIIRNTAVTEVDFSSSPQVGGSPLTVSLNITHSGNADKYDIDWGDGTSSYNQSASTLQHIYNQSSGAQNTVTVTARNSNGIGAGHSQSLIKQNYITIYTPNPVVDFDIYDALSGGSQISIWDDATTVYFENTTTNVSGFDVDYTISWGDSITDQVLSNDDVGGVGGLRRQHTYNNNSETDTIYTLQTTLNTHSAADPAVIPTSTSKTFKVYSEHTPTLSGLTTIGINSESNSGYPITLTNTTESSIGSYNNFGIQYRYVWGDGETTTVNTGSGSAGDTNQTISHTYDLTDNSAGISSTYFARLEVISNHTNSPFLSSDFEVLVEPEVRSIFTGIATVTSDRVGDDDRDVYNGTDLFGRDRRVAVFTNNSHNASDYVWDWDDSSALEVIPDNVSAGGTSTQIYHAFLPVGPSTKTVVLTANGQPGHIVQNGRTSSLNFVLNPVPTAPTSLNTRSLTLATASQGFTPYLCAGATRNETGSGISTGSSINRYVTVTSVNTNYLNDVNGSHTGTLTANLNGSSIGQQTFTTATGELGTFSDLHISSEGDAHDEISSSIYPTGFFQCFTARITKALSGISAGVNDYSLVHSVDGSCGFTTFVKDDLNTTPTLTAGTLSESSGGTKRYISGIPYYDSGGPTLSLTGVQVTNFTGQTYQNTSTPVEIFTGTTYESTIGVVISTQYYTYAQVDGSISFIDPTYNVPLANTGVGSPYTFGSLSIPLTTSNTRTVQDLRIRAKNATGTGSYTSTSTKVQVHTAAQSGISEIAIAVADALGNGVYTDDAVRIFDFSVATTDTPSFTGSTNFYTNSPYTEASDPGVAGTKEATIRIGVLKHDTTDYSTGFLPVGPDRSGDTGTQYFTFAFRRQVVANFDINITSSTGVAGVWIAAPGTQTDTTSGLNGWLRADTPYAGSGVPGSGVGGNGSDGCAANSGDRILPSTALSGGYTMTLGSENMSNATGNVVLVRIALTSGQSITNLSVGEAN